MEEWIQIHLLQFVVSAVCLWRRMSEDLTPPACASLNTAQNCSKEPLPSPLPSLHPLPLENTARAAGETVLRFCRRGKGLSSATPETTAPSQLAETRLGATAPARALLSGWAPAHTSAFHMLLSGPHLHNKPAGYQGWLLGVGMWPQHEVWG